MGHNPNKFYIPQCLKEEGQYRVLFRWGRLGEPGTTKVEDYVSEAQATGRFEKQFRDKTKNSWADRAAFVKHSGKYQLIG